MAEGAQGPRTWDPRARDPLVPLLAGGRVAVIDGGLATELEDAGHDLRDRLWSARLLADEPEAIVAAHLAYFRAGARVAITASYQATFEGFAVRGLDHDEAAALLRRSVELAGEARARYRAERAPADPGPLLVAASIGPYGAALADGAEYRGRYGLDRPALRDFHRERLRVLWGARPDLLACETIPDVVEVRALADLVHEAAAPAWLTLSCADGGHLRDGTPVAEAAAIADATPGFVAVGVNCTAPEHVEELVARIAATTAKPIVVYPNSGERWEAGTGRWLPATGPDVDVASARRWVAAGARLVGGCCRVGPGRIGELAASFGG
jgi:S-methylmethionine-dependent homocysteine/selenocysteine methylase